MPRRTVLGQLVKDEQGCELDNTKFPDSDDCTVILEETDLVF